MKYKPSPPFRLLRRLLLSIEKNGVRGAMVRSWQRLARSFGKHGLRGTLDRAFVHAPSPIPVTQQVALPAQPHSFDVLHGVDTSGYLSGASLPSISLSGIYTTAYLGIAASALEQAIAALPLDHSLFTFVDIGCGKGRALIVAEQFRFPRLLGVELTPELSEIARANIATHADWAARTTVLNQDATTVVYPDGPLVLFLYDPFHAPVLRRVLENLERQLRSAPREVWLLYANNPRLDRVLERFPWLVEVSHTHYPLTAEEIALSPLKSVDEQFTLYRCDLEG